MEKLRETLAQEDVVIFVGSGISLWSGLPTWSGLIDQLVDYVEQAGNDASLVRSEKGKGELLQAASYGFDLLTKQQIGEFIRSACKYGVAKPHDIHRKLVSFNARCYITTNYDNLIEQALNQWQPDVFFPPAITNRQLTETANIVTARATNFVFKPHGDAADADSIILTREQYRDLLPQGERHFALEALKTILATRPVVYLGFGLRDPDFLYLRDLLANTYKGGTRDHYAVMSDIEDAEVRYWRRNYGIHLVGYETNKLPDGRRDHSPLLNLLDSYAPKSVEAPNGHSMNADSLALSLVRHSARLVRYRRVDSEFAIHVEQRERSPSTSRTFDRFSYCSVSTFLKEFPKRAIFIGLPGAGKTYSLNIAASEIAEQLHACCISEELDVGSIVVPVVADMKSYRGSLRNLIDNTLPSGLSVDELSNKVRLRVFLDSFNEMPKDHWESGAYADDLRNFLDSLGTTPVIIGSRTTDGLEQLNWPTYYLEQIDRDTVRSELIRIGVVLDPAYDHELVGLLGKPFFFRYIVEGKLDLPKTGNPREFYDQYFSRIQNRFSERFSSNLDIQPVLSSCAYEALDRGEETFSVNMLLTKLRKTGAEANVEPTDVINWLVSEEVVAPYSDGRIAFIHQSLTEFLAAKKLAKVYVAEPGILQEKLSLYRWDQALFLTLSLLPADFEERFVSDVLRTDLELGLAAVKYLDHNRDDVLAQMLDKVAELAPSLNQFGRINWLIEHNLPISAVHEPQLRKLIAAGNTIGGAAAQRLIRIRGKDVKDEMLDLLVEHRNDFNFCVNGLAPPLRDLVVTDDLDRIVRLVDSVSDEVIVESNDEAACGLIRGVSSIVGSMPLSILREKFFADFESDRVSEIRGRVLATELQDRRTTEGLELAAELLLLGIDRASSAIYFIGKFNKDVVLSWHPFERQHIDRLIKMAFSSTEDENSPIDAIRVICEFRSDLAEYVRQEAAQYSPVFRAVLLTTTGADQSDGVFEALESLQERDAERNRFDNCHLLSDVPLEWIGREDLFIDLLKLRNLDLALALLQPFNNVKSSIGEVHIGEVHIGDVDWWLDWIVEAKNYWLTYYLSLLFSAHLPDEKRSEFLHKFNHESGKHRHALQRLLPRMFGDLSTDDLSPDAISFLLADLSRTERLNWDGHLLGAVATDRFVEEKLLPLAISSPSLAITKVLEQAGKRHGRRYVADVRN